MRNLEAQVINHDSLNGAEKTLFKYEKKFAIEYLQMTEEQAEQKAFEKIANVRQMSKELSNPKSKAYFPY
jgi:hypothetical protein